MEISTILIISLSILAVILLYTTINLLRKNEKADDIVVGYLKVMMKLVFSLNK